MSGLGDPREQKGLSPGLKKHGTVFFIMEAGT